MFSNEKRIVVEWGDCDPANIVFFPRYLEWGDACTNDLFGAAGFPIATAFKNHGVLGMPMVDLKARFLKPSTYGDELIARSTVMQLGKSSFVIRHQFLEKEDLRVEITETRVWVARDPTDPREVRMKAQVIPEHVVKRLSAGK